MPISWTENLSVKNNVIDDDHKYLIELINEVELAVKAKMPEGLNASVERLKKYAKFHFAREEKISRLIAYEQADHLHHAHIELTERLDGQRAVLGENADQWNDEASKSFVNFIRDWLLSHVIKEDLLMKKTLQRYPADFNPFSVSQLKAGREDDR